MKKTTVVLAVWLVVAIAAGCAHRPPSSVYLKTADDQGIFFGRLAPVQGIEEGWVRVRVNGDSARKIGLDSDGHFMAKVDAGTVELLEFAYRDRNGTATVSLATPHRVNVEAGVVTYAGVVIVSPLSRNVYLTDDFFRDRAWFTARYGDDLAPRSMFPNQKFYELMETHAATTPGAPRIENGRARIPATRFLMGDIWPGDGIDGPAGADRSQVPPHEVAVDAYAIDVAPVPAKALGREGDLPADGVTWAAADALCRARGGRLPTEAEFELAVRGPRWGERFYGGVPALTSGKAVADGQLPAANDHAAWTPGPWGVAANGASLAEWTADWYSPATFSAGKSPNPTGPVSGIERVVRAGPYRFAVDPAQAPSNVGFRCVYDGAAIARPPAPKTAAVEPVVEAPEPQAPARHTLREVDLLAGPSADAAVLGRVPADTPVDVTSETDEFYLVRLPGGDEGFIPKEALSGSAGERK